MSASGAAGRCAPCWLKAFARLVGSPAPSPAADSPQTPDGSAGSFVARRASRLIRPSTGWRFKTEDVTGGRFGGVAEAPANPFPQLCQLGGQGGELASQQLDLRLLGINQRSDAGGSFQPERFWNPSRKCAHHRRPLTEIQPGIKLPSRYKQDLMSAASFPAPERILCLIHKARREKNRVKCR